MSVRASCPGLCRRVPCALDAPSARPLGGSAAGPSRSVRTSQPSLSASASRHRTRRCRIGSSCSALRRRCDVATMASADFCPRIVHALTARLASRHASRSPRVRRVTFAPSTRRIYAAPVRMTSGFESFVPSRPPALRLVCGSCSSGRSFACGFLPTTPRGDAVAVRLGVPVIKVPRGLSPPRHFPIRFRYRLTAPVTALRAMPGAHEVGRTLSGPPCHTVRLKPDTTYYSAQPPFIRRPGSSSPSRCPGRSIPPSAAPTHRRFQPPDQGLV